MTVKVVMLVGGETTGTRFRPLTMDFHKCLFPVAGKPLLSHIIDNLKGLGSDLGEIFLVSFFKDTARFESYIEQCKTEFPGLKITLLTEPTPMGTGGGIFYFKDQILGLAPDSTILLIHGDIVCDYPFKDLLEFQKSSSADVAIMGVDPLVLLKDKAFKGLDKENLLRRYGTVFSSKNSHRIVHYVEKPKSDSFAQFGDTGYQTSINGGIYVFNLSIFLLLEKAQEKKLSGEPYYDLDEQQDPYYPNILSFELDVFKTLPATDNIKFLNFNFTSPWYQLTTPAFALAANAFFLKKETGESTATVVYPVLNQSGSQLEGCKIGPDVTIGHNVTIGEGVRLKNCVICDDVIIGSHSIVAGAIVSQGVKIGKWCRIEGTLDSPVSQPSPENASNLLSNMVVLCKGTVVSNQVFVYNSMVLPHKELRADVKYEIVM